MRHHQAKDDIQRSPLSYGSPIEQCKFAVKRLMTDRRARAAMVLTLSNRGILLFAISELPTHIMLTADGDGRE